ncbi:MAG: hypothetical protein LBF27_09380 [Sphingobacterium sp.]|jgi:cytochrome c peroxidase|nr:hypothetical protein [Sphingobacterium sp.]
MYRKFVVVALLFAVVLTLGFGTGRPQHPKQDDSNFRERKIQQAIVSQMLSFRRYVRDTLYSVATSEPMDTLHLQRVFLTSRLLFKDFEWAAEYFTADLTKRLNGPPVEEIENADLLDPTLARGVNPVGLQVIEELIYPNYEIVNQQKLRTEIRHLILNVDYLISYFSDHDLDDWRILDAAKLEIFRIISLGITGYDNGLALNSITESARSLASLQNVLVYYGDKKKNSMLFQALEAGIKYLQVHTDFDSFDRAVFITRFANRISTGIAEIEQAMPGNRIRYNRMLRQEVNTLFDEDAFNANAFSPGPEFHLTDEKVVLGEKLFYDVQLSGTGTRSCASCHNPNRAFTDGLARQDDIHGSGQLLKRNTPTLLNSALQSNYFYDMHALTLEDQIRDVIGNTQEMDGSMDHISLYLSGNKAYRKLFNQAFPNSNGTINSDHIANALASYLRHLTKINSRFDEYMRGKDDALSKQELQGFNLFMGKAKCATCHFIPLFNGVTPPKFVQSEVEVLGVPGTLKDSILDADLGYFDVIGIDSYRNAFKIPSVRNIKKTAPYMHNGVYRTLDEVMEFYNNGGGAGLGINIPNQTLPEENLRLTEDEKKDIIAFMESLESQ